LLWIDIDAFDGNNTSEKNSFLNHIDARLDLNKYSYDLKYFKKFMDEWKEYVTYWDQKDKSLRRNSKRLYEIQYILKTGANWRGPIGKFRLEITPDNPDDLIIVEGKYPLKRQSDGVCVVELQNFTPTENLRIWMLQTKYEWDEWDAQQEALKPTVWKRFKSWVMRFISAK
jgi:hypothetical protein